MRLLPILLLAACLQNPNVSQEASSNDNQEYVLRYNGGKMCVAKDVENMGCVPVTLKSQPILYYSFDSDLPLKINKDEEKSLSSFNLHVRFDFQDGSQKFKKCSTWEGLPWARNMPFTISDSYDVNTVRCSDTIDTDKVAEEKNSFREICPLDKTKLQHEYESGAHSYLYTDDKCKLRLYVYSRAITPLRSIKNLSKIMQCSTENDRLMKFKFKNTVLGVPTTDKFFTISCTDSGIKFKQDKKEVEAKMAADKEYSPIGNEYELGIMWSVADEKIKVVAKLPKSSGMNYGKWVSDGHETRIITYDDTGKAKPIERAVYSW